MAVGSYLLIRDVKGLLEAGVKTIGVEMMDGADGTVKGSISCTLDTLTEEERKILLSGSLINYYV